LTTGVSFGATVTSLPTDCVVDVPTGGCFRLLFFFFPPAASRDKMEGTMACRELWWCNGTNASAKDSPSNETKMVIAERNMTKGLSKQQ
jgi:hypothetical protein